MGIRYEEMHLAQLLNAQSMGYLMKILHHVKVSLCFNTAGSL